MSSSDRHQARRSPVGPITISLVVGALPTAGRLWGHGPNGRFGATALVVGALAWVVGLSVSSPRRSTWILPLTAAVATIAVVVPRLGRAAPLVVLGASGLVFVSLRPPLGRRWAATPFAVAPVAALSTWWNATGSTLVLLTGFAVAAAVWAATQAGHPLAVAANRAAERAIGSVTDIVRLATLAVVVGPLVYLPALAARPVRSRTRRRLRATGSTWQERTVTADEDRRVAHRPFEAVSTARRRRGQLAGTLIVLAGLLGVLAITRDRPDRPVVAPTARGATTVTTAGASPSRTVTPLSQIPAFADVRWADAIQAEHGRLGTTDLPLNPTTGYGLGDFSGRYTSTEAGVRTTLASTCECPTVTVWWVGGSAAFGWWQRDEHTIASDLVRGAEQSGIRLDVTNLAVPGWTLVQEAGAVMARLDTTEKRPDLVIFYDGFNDIAGAIVEAAASGKIPPEQDNRLDGTLMARLGSEWSATSLAEAGGAEVVGTVAGDRYRRVADDTRRRLEAEGVAVRFVEQPDPFGSIRQLDTIRAVTGHPGSDVVRSEWAATFERASAVIAPDVLDLRHSLDDSSDPVFADTSHTNEAGAAAVADRVGTALDDLFRRIAR